MDLARARLSLRLRLMLRLRWGRLRWEITPRPLVRGTVLVRPRVVVVVVAGAVVLVGRLWTAWAAAAAVCGCSNLDVSKGLGETSGRDDIFEKCAMCEGLNA